MHSFFLIRTFSAAILALWLVGCASPTESRSGGSYDQPAPERRGDSVSVYEQRLIEVVREEQRLERYTAREDAEYSEAQRRFHGVSRQYLTLIANNPDELEPRLLYGKLLNRYGDGLGAMEQFHAALDINSNVPMAYQQLSVIYAEEGEYGTALAYALEAVDRDPLEAVYHYGIGELIAYFRDEMVTDGVNSEEELDAQMIRAFAQAAELEPDLLSMQFRYGEAYYDMAEPDWEAALKQWQGMAERLGGEMGSTERDALRLHTARVLAELGHMDAAREEAERVVSKGLLATRDDLIRQFDEWIERESVDE